MQELSRDGKIRRNHLRDTIWSMVFDVEARARVVLQGLTARPELNGRHGTVTELSPLTDAAGETRWPILLDPSRADPRGQGVKAKTCNLRVLCVRRPSPDAPVPSAKTLATFTQRDHQGSGLLNHVSATLDVEMSMAPRPMSAVLMNLVTSPDSVVTNISLKPRSYTEEAVEDMTEEQLNHLVR
jgi:hypothetical protein